MGILGDYMRRFIVKTLLLALICTCILTAARVFVPVIKVNNSMFRLMMVHDSKKYERLTDNTMKCDLVTYSNIVLMMIEDGYVITSEESSDEFIDVVLTQGDTSYRLYYEASEDFISLSNVYEKSYIPMTYINES